MFYSSKNIPVIYMLNIVRIIAVVQHVPTVGISYD